MNDHIKILIVGGYGIFGGRIVELLENEQRLALVVSGRSFAKADTFCKSRVNAKATLIPALFDRSTPLNSLKELKPDIVIDASGPFQAYGDDRYSLVEACLETHAHYLDLADGAEFVNGIAAFDEKAKEAGIFILSGVSSFPVLTALVVRDLTKDMPIIDSIVGGIAPSPFAGVGENVIRAIAGYAGQPIPIKKNGQICTGYPFTDSRRYTVSPPGRLPLKNILFSLVEVPDLKVLAELWPTAKTVWMGAGPVPEILHHALIGFSWLVRLKFLPSLTPMVKLIQFVMNHVRWGEHRGGMFVEVIGRNHQDKPLKKSWHLLAEGRDGPLIPCMAIEAIIHKIMRGDKIPSGARTAIQDLNLADYDFLFSRRTIYTGFRQDEPKTSAPLYKSILGNAWDHLPQPILSMHDIVSLSRVEGTATIERGKNPLANLIANILKFPKAGNNVPVSVDFFVINGAEKWTRTFNGRSFSSLQFAGAGKDDRLLVEQFGPIRFALALVHNQADQSLHLVIRHWSFLGIPMPMLLCPTSDSYEFGENGRFNFHVKISHPLVGLIIYYRGWLEKADPH